MTEPITPARAVHTGDALAWLAARGEFTGTSVVTSLPDVSELGGMSLAAWRGWFIRAAKACLQATPPDGLTVFYQTDIKRDGAWVDKGYLCARAAEEAGVPLRWHKVVCRTAPGHTTYGRPAYAHLLCFSRGVAAEPEQSTPDVLPVAGHMTWARAMPVGACVLSCRIILADTRTRTVLDPFCGMGTVLAVANALGLSAVGVEKSPKRAERSRQLIIPKAMLSGLPPRDEGSRMGQ